MDGGVARKPKPRKVVDMMKPRKHNDQKSLLNAAMLAEREWLDRNAPTFGNTAPADYADRAKAFNAECKKLGASLMMVVEG